MRNSGWLALMAGFSLWLSGASLWASPLKSDEEVLFLPDLAREISGNRVKVFVNAWVFEPENRPGMASALAAYLDRDLDDINSEEQKLFSERCRLFKTDSERGKQIEIVFDGLPGAFPLARTDQSGKSFSSLILDMKAPDREIFLPFRLKPPEGIRSQTKGLALFIPARGISVISDLDDTIKVTEVLDQKAMLINTFFREFSAVPGMADLYKKLARKGVSFHYLSASPIQLYPALSDFLETKGFPKGSMHLRESTSWRSLIPGKSDSRHHKETNILRILETFPERRFILIGDSGEADPEIYADIARKHPEKILTIGIRDVTGEDEQSARYAAAFADLPKDLWQIFTKAPDWQSFVKKK